VPVHDVGVLRPVPDRLAAHADHDPVGGPPLAGEFIRWLITGKGILTYSPRSSPPRSRCWRSRHTRYAVHLGAGQLQGRSDRRARGDAGPERRRLANAALVARHVEVRSNRPGDMPVINPRYLSEETDRRAIIGGLRLARRIFAAPALKQFVRDESLPGGHIQTDHELLDYARHNGGTCYHASCSCMMGSHPTSVVDSDCMCTVSMGCGSSTPR
jgi:choline dehydrogenase